MKEEIDTEIVVAVIDELMDYSGFDSWWEAIGRIDQNVIKGNLSERIHWILEKI